MGLVEVGSVKCVQPIGERSVRRVERSVRRVTRETDRCEGCARGTGRCEGVRNQSVSRVRPIDERGVCVTKLSQVSVNGICE